MGNKPATTTTTTTQNQTRNPWDPAIKPLQGIIDRSTELAGDPTRFTPTYSDTTRRGIGGLEDIANSGGPGGYDALANLVGGSGMGFQGGLGQMMNVAGGGMLNSNPHFDQVVDRAATDTASKVNSMFTAGGRYGSGAHAGTLGREVGNVVGSMRNQNFAQERQAQDQAARTLFGGGFQGGSMAGAMDQAQLRPAQLNLQAGQMRDQMENAERTAPMNALQWQAGMINPIAGMGGTNNSTGTQTQQTRQPTNWLSTGLGAGMMGLGALTGNPALMAGGANGMMGSLGGGGGGGGGMFNAGMFGGMFGGGGGGGDVNGWANNDPGGSYYY